MGAKGDRTDPDRMAGKHSEANGILSLSHIPYLNRSILAPDSEQRALCIEGEGTRSCALEPETRQAMPAGRVPELEMAVFVPTGKYLS